MNLNEPTSLSVIKLFVCDEIIVADVFELTSCLFFIIEDFSLGYQYSESGGNIDRAFDILFEQTLINLQQKKPN